MRLLQTTRQTSSNVQLPLLETYQKVMRQMINPRNSWTFWAGVVADPEVKELSGGTRVAELRLALDRAKRSSIDKEDTTAWLDAVVYDNGDRDSKFIFDQITDGKLKKGSQIAVSAEYREDEWEQDDKKRQRTKVHINGIAYLPSGKKKDEDGDSDGASSSNTAGSAISKF